MLALVPQPIQGELRIKDADLGKRLGFSRPDDIRKLIERHAESLSKISVLATVAQTPGLAKGGRPSTRYYLNRKQAIFITAKSDTDVAVDVTIEVIERFDAYERGVPSMPTSAPTMQKRTPRQVTSVFGSYLRIARLIGLDQNQAAISAGRATKAAVGEDPLDTLGVTHLLAPQQEAALTPTDIGVRLGGKSGMAVNSLLAERGLQIGRRDAKDRTYWEPTEAGMAHAVFLDTGKKHSDGTPVRQLKWAAGVLEVLSTEQTA